MAGLKYPLSLVIRAVDETTRPLQQFNQRLERSAARATAPFRRLGNRLSALSSAAGLPKVVAGFKGVGDAAGALGSRVLGIGGALAGMAAVGGLAFYGIVRGAQEAGGRLKNLSTTTGFSVNAFAELEFAAKRSGVGAEEFASGMQKFNKALSESRRGVGPLAGLLEKVSPALLEQLKAAKSNEEAFTLVAKAMAKVEGPGRKAELAVAAFGKAGAGMVNALKDGPEGVEALRAEYRALVGDQTKFAAGANAFGDALDNLELSMLGLRNAGVGPLMPALTKLSEAATEFIVKNRDKLEKWATKTGDAIIKWVDGGGIDRLVDGFKDIASEVSKAVDKIGGLENALIAAGLAMAAPILSPMATLGTNLVVLGKEVLLVAYRFGTVLVGALGKAALGILGFNFAPLLAGLGAAAKAAWAFNVALLANPIGLLIGLVAVFAAVVYANWEPISGFVKDLWQTIKFYTVQAWESVSSFVSDVWDGIVSRATAAWEKLRPIIDAVKTGLGFVLAPAELAAQAGVAIEQRFFSDSPRSALGAASALPQGRPGAGGDARVTVDFTGLPRGARVTSARENTAPLELNLGYAMGDMR